MLATSATDSMLSWLPASYPMHLGQIASGHIQVASSSLPVALGQGPLPVAWGQGLEEALHLVHSCLLQGGGRPVACLPVACSRVRYGLEDPLEEVQLEEEVA